MWYPPPLLRVEARSEFFVAKGVSDREGEKEVQRETEPEQPSCEKETKRREERGQSSILAGMRSQPIGDSPLRRNT